MQIKTKQLNDEVLFVVGCLAAAGIISATLLGSYTAVQNNTPTIQSVALEIPMSLESKQASTSFNSANYQVQVLNGSGKSGAAHELAEKLRSAGWNVVSVGNTPSSPWSVLVPKTIDGSDRSALLTVINDILPYQINSLGLSTTNQIIITIGNE